MPKAAAKVVGSAGTVAAGSAASAAVSSAGGIAAFGGGGNIAWANRLITRPLSPAIKVAASSAMAGNRSASQPLRSALVKS